MRIFSFFFTCLYDLKQVVTYRNKRVSSVLRYALLIAFIWFLPFAVNGIDDVVIMKKAINSFVDNPNTSASFSDYKLSTSLKKPVYKDLSSGVILLDSTGELSAEEAYAKYGASIAILKDRISVMNGTNTIETYYKDIIAPEFLASFSKEDLKIFSGNTLNMTLIIILLLLFVVFIGIIFFISAFVAILGHLIAQVFFRVLSYKEAWKLTIYSKTLPITYLATMNFFRLTLPFWFATLWIVTLLIFVLMIRYLPKKE